MRKARIVPFCILLLSLGSVEADAQATSRVAGVVKDQTAAIIAGAKVTLTNEATNVSVTTTTTSAGNYVFDGIIPGTYTVAVGASGFSTFSSRGNTLTIAQPMVVNVTLKVGETEIRMEVNAGAELVQTETSGNLGALIDQRALETLPIVGARGRSPLDLLELIPGVVDGGPMNSGGANIAGGGVSVNGSRDRAWNYTLDGIDINETSAGGSNFAPLRTNPDSLAGFRVITSNASPEYGRNSGAQVILETRPGTNNFHGNVFWFYQTPGLNANDPGNKENGLPRPQFIQHIGGFSLGGPVFKNKTFFFVNTQFLHTSQSFPVTSIVYTKEARMGTIRYVLNPVDCGVGPNPPCPNQNSPAGSSNPSVDSNGNPIVPIGTYLVAPDDYALRGLDSSIQSYIGLTPLPNNFMVGDGLNTAGFLWQAPENERQVDFTVRIDHEINSRNSIFGRWSHGHQNTIGDSGNGGLAPFPGAPNIVDTTRQPRNLAISWRYTPKATVTNVVTVGMNRFIFDFLTPGNHVEKNPPYVLNGDTQASGFLTGPLQNGIGNLRALTTIQLVDDLSYIRGKHLLKFGTNLRYQRHIDDRGSIGSLNASPSVFFNTDVARVDDCSTNPPPCFHLPHDINGSFDLPTLQGAINNLLGRVGNINQGFVALNANQYAPAGTHLADEFRMPEYDFYAQDSWKIRPNLTLDFGLRWEIKLSPRTSSNFLLHPNQPFTVGAAPSDTLSWVSGPLYGDAWRNFGPSIGLAWDPFNNGKSSVRANYRLAYDRMNTFVLSSSVFQGLPGEALQITDQSFGKSGGRVADGIPILAPDPATTPLLERTPPSFSPNANTVVDPRWKPPQVHEWSLSLQRQVGRSTVAEVSYIGRHAVHLFGAYDSNQAQIRNNGFLDAFKTVQAGGDSALIDQLLLNDPSRQSAGVSGSVFITDQNGPYGTDFSLGSVSAVASSIGLATDAKGVPLPVSAGLSSSFFFKYPQYSNGLNVLDSGDWSWYNGLQATYRGTFHDLTFQMNYTWSKSMDTRSFDPTFSTVVFGSSSFGASSTPFDNTNRRRNYAPSDFDRTHVFQSVWTYRIPFGKDRKWGNNWGSIADHLVGGWGLSGIFVAESGHPTTIYSSAFTTSSIVRTPANCAGCTHDMFQVHRDATTGSLNYMTPAQMAQFSAPGPGEFSNVGRNFFRLAPYSVVNLSFGKETQLKWNHTLEVRVEMQNAFNSVHYDQPARARFDRSDFGVLDANTVENFQATGSSPRTIQLSAKYSF